MFCVIKSHEFHIFVTPTLQLKQTVHCNTFGERIDNITFLLYLFAYSLTNSSTKVVSLYLCYLLFCLFFKWWHTLAPITIPPAMYSYLLAKIGSYLPVFHHTQREVLICILCGTRDDILIVQFTFSCAVVDINCCARHAHPRGLKFLTCFDVLNAMQC